jgi:hypothetical protein
MTTQDGSDSSPTAIAEPPCSEEEFAQEIRELVAEEAPRVFALVEEHASGSTAGSSAGGSPSTTASRSSVPTAGCA